MKKKFNSDEPIDKTTDEKELLGYPLYPPEEDIYYMNERVDDIDPDDLSKKKKRNEVPETMNEKDFEDDMSGSDLDIPGSELDDDQEDIGSEDEENNYYSLGGDNHDDDYDLDQYDDVESNTTEGNEL